MGKKNSTGTGAASPTLAGELARAAFPTSKPERKTRRVQLLIKPSTWEAVAKAAREADYSWNDWAELVLAAAASPAAKVEAELSPHFQALAQAAAEKSARKRSKRPELSRLELARVAEERLADRLSSQMELP